MRFCPSARIVCAALLAVSISIGGVGCAGSSLSKIGSSANLTKELPKDLQDKFEVREVGDPAAAPSPQVVLVSETIKKPTKKAARKKKRSKIKAVAKVAAPPAFEYPNRRPVKDPIWLGEKLTYEITYLGLAAASFTLEALPYKEIDNRKVYHIQGTAKSLAVFNLIYKLEDTAQTFIDFDGIFSHRFHIQLDETKQVRDSLELFDSEKKQTFWWNRWNRKEKGYEEKKEFFPMDPFPQDTLSSLYYLRTVPLPDGAEVRFPVMSEGKPTDAVVTVMGRETMHTPLGDRRVIKLKPEAQTRGVLERRGTSYLWVTDDDRRFMVRMEAKVKIGTVVANLKHVELGTDPTTTPEPEVSPSPKQQ